MVTACVNYEVHLNLGHYQLVTECTLLSWVSQEVVLVQQVVVDERMWHAQSSLPER